MKLTAVHTGQCEMSARLFILSCKKGYDSRDFIDKLLSSDLAVHMYHDEISSIWLGEKYLMETLEEEVKIKKGEVLSADFMEWAGYLYRVWSIDYPQETPKDMLEQGPCEVLQQMYLGTHVMSYEMAIQNVKSAYLERERIRKNRERFIEEEELSL